VEEAQGLLKLCDQFKVERDDLKTQIGLKPPSMGADGRYHKIADRVVDPDSESGSGSRRAKMTHKSRQ
jgi:hypothetical protein